MSSLMTEPTVTTGRAWGGQSMVAPLKRVLVRKPAAPAAEGHFADFGYPRAVDHGRTEREHDAFRALLAEAGAEVVLAGPDETGLLDAIFAYDPSLMTDAGAVLLRPGKATETRRGRSRRTKLRGAGDPGHRTHRGAGHGRGRRHPLARRAHAGRRTRLSHK